MSILRCDPSFDPYPLSDDAVYELLHFSHWGGNLLRTRIEGLPELRMAPMMPLINERTGEATMLPTSREHKAEVLAAIRRMREA